MNTQAVWAALKETGNSWLDDKVMRLSASLAYYTVLAAAPLVVLAVSIASLVFQEGAVRGQVTGQLQGLIGEEGARAVTAMLDHSSQPGSSIPAIVVGLIILLVGASGVFVEMQDALNTIWGVTPKPGRAVWTMVRDRFVSMAMVLGTGFLLLVTLILSTVLSTLTRFAGLDRIGFVGEALNFLISFAVVTVLFMLIFKVLPDVKIVWRDVWIGAAVTSLLFTIGRFLIGLYLGRAGVGSAYGAAGSVVVFVVWVYYSAMILYTGAEFTKVYAKRWGSRIRPADNAVPVTAEARAEQGLAPRQTAGAGGMK